jgi:hypothetical protein
MQVEVSDDAVDLVRRKGGIVAVDWIPKYG